uniref:Reverse transcriptase zinc-binding domain-containing protein n=1 Tax=Davidia involucrata TaxID=16924 RepID=A0A5B7BYU4_DAVIN
MEDLASLMDTLEGMRFEPGQADSLVWPSRPSKIFSVRSYYEALVRGEGAEFPWRAVWCSGVPRKVSFFAWSAAWGAILTIDNLQKRDFLMANRCCLCKVEMETVGHILLHCGLVRDLWGMLLSLFGMNWVMPYSMESMFFLFGGGLLGLGKT